MEIQLRNFGDIAWRLRRVLVWFLGAFGILATLFGASFVQGSRSPWLAITAGVIALFAIVVYEMENDSDKDWPESKVRRRVWFLILVPIFSPLSLWVVVQPAGDAVRVNTSTSTLNQGVFLNSGFPPEKVYVVYRELNYVLASTNITSKDGFPLRCSVVAKGVILDTENPALEQILESLAATGSVQGALEDVVRGALAEEARHVLAERETSELERDQHFVIPYQIGRPLTSALRNNALRWSGGKVSFDCSPNLDGI